MSFFDEVTKLSSNSQEDKEERNRKRYQKAEDMAFDKITDKMKDKMRDEAKRGFKSAIIHSWKFVKNRDDLKCIGVSKFNGVWIKDLCDKGNLIGRISEFINEENENKFRIFINKRIDTFRMIVSWNLQNKNKSVSK